MARTLEQLGERIRKLRELRGMSQGDLADALGVSRPTLSLYESGKTEPRWTIIADLLAMLGVSLSVFTDDDVDWPDVKRQVLQKQLDDLLLGSPTETPFDAHNTNHDGAHSTNHDAGQERETDSRKRLNLGVRGALAGVGA